MQDRVSLPSGERRRRRPSVGLPAVERTSQRSLEEHLVIGLQRTVGNRATRTLIQRLDDEDLGAIGEGIGIITNPLGYAAGEAGKWGAEKVKELSGANDHAAGDSGATHEWGDEDHVVGEGVTHEPGGEDHVVGDDHVVGEGVTHGPGGAGGKGPGGGGAGPGETVGSDPLVGLRAGDGLEVGTWQRRPRVKLLQYRLNEVVAAGLKVDGMWGKKTSAALEAFQLAHHIVPLAEVDAATSGVLSGAAPGSAEAPGGTQAGGGPGQGASLPDISGLVAPDVLTRWQSPLAVAPGSAVPGGSSHEPSGPAGGGVAPAAGGLGGGGGLPAVGVASGFAGSPAAGGGGGTAMGIKTDPDTLARFEYYKPVLYDMWRRYDRAANDTQAYFALLQQSAAAAGYWASRAFSSICASLAGIVLGPPGVALWSLADRFWSLGARMAEETERPILEAATAPALDALIAFGNIVQQSFDNAYPMQTPQMPWYVVGSGWIQGPTSTLINAYGQVQRLRQF